MEPEFHVEGIYKTNSFYVFEYSGQLPGVEIANSYEENF